MKKNFDLLICYILSTLNTIARKNNWSNLEYITMNYFLIASDKLWNPLEN